MYGLTGKDALLFLDIRHQSYILRVMMFRFRYISLTIMFCYVATSLAVAGLDAPGGRIAAGVRSGDGKARGGGTSSFTPTRYLPMVKPVTQADQAMVLLVSSQISSGRDTGIVRSGERAAPNILLIALLRDRAPPVS